MKFTIALAAVGCLLPAVASAQVASGLRVEARVGWETPTFSEIEEGDDDIYKLGNAVSFGGEAGFDLAVSRGVSVGPYVTWEKSNVESCADGACLSVKDNLGTGARVGFATSPEGQLFVKVGYARITLEGSIDGFSDSEQRSGVQGAIGYQHGFGQRLYAAFEGNYGDYGEVYGAKMQRRQALVALGVRF